MSIALHKVLDIKDLKVALNECFSEIEALDEIVKYAYVNARTMKELILRVPSEIAFDYIPNGVGYLRTAYLKFHPGLMDGVVRFTTDQETVILRLELNS